MNYRKPEVAVVGQAVHLIENIPSQKPPQTLFDGPLPLANPAYDLDE